MICSSSGPVANTTGVKGSGRSLQMHWIAARRYQVELSSDLPSEHLLAVAKGQAQAGGRSVVAACKTWWWAIIPIAIEGEIPVQFAEKLDVVRSTQIEVHAAKVRNGRQEGSIRCKGSSVKAEKPQA